MINDWKPEKNISSPWDADIDTNKITSIKDVKALFDAIGLKISETNENFDKVKHQPKTLDE
jgi:hypothetical protein